MAAVLEDLLLKILEDKAAEEIRMLLGVSGEIKKLQDILVSINDFLADAERRRITEESVQLWVNRLKDAMYDATDILELCQLKAEERQESVGGGSAGCCASIKERLPGCLKRLLFCLQDPVFAHNMGSQIKELNQRLDSINAQASNYTFLRSLGGPDWKARAVTHEQDVTPPPGRKKTWLLDNSAIVGDKIENDTRALVQELLSKDHGRSIRVLSIVGKGGIGKTTLAQKIYNDKKIIVEFEKMIWLSITENFNQTELLRTALDHARTKHNKDVVAENIRQTSVDASTLEDNLMQELSNGKFLLVLDDMWSVEAWKVFEVLVKKAGHHQPDSRVVVTTRMRNLVRQMSTLFHQHVVEEMKDKDAWSLLKKQLSPQEVRNENDLDQLKDIKDIGLKIIEKCGGLPLAIKVIGGLLSSKPLSVPEWKGVLDNSAWSTVQMPEELNNSLYLSYEDLTPQLKQCFLYYSLLPKSSVEFGRDLFVSMWISEGFVQRKQSLRQLEEIGADYYQELITRNLIEPTEESGNEYLCRMHDVVREFAHFISREEALLVVPGKEKKTIPDDASTSTGLVSSSKLRRVSVESADSLPPEKWIFLQNQDSLRTLIMVGDRDFKPGFSSLASFSSLRVLHISHVDPGWLVGSLCKLKHLRYLSIDTDISGLLEDIDKMKFLQYVLLRKCGNPAQFPSSITKLKQLRFLCMPMMSGVVPKDFNQLTNLRSLFGFPVQMVEGGLCNLEVLGTLSQLRQLDLDGLERVSSSSLAQKAMISSKQHLRTLNLNCNNSNSRSARPTEQQQRVIEQVYDYLFPPPSIDNLSILGYFGHRMPIWLREAEAAAFTSLRYITFANLSCCTQLPDGLRRLPALGMLVIENMEAIERVGPEFQAALADKSPAFRMLTRFSLDGLPRWEEWDWDEEVDVMTMPLLERLMINNCRLSCLPPGLVNSGRCRPLRELYLYDLPELIYLENLPWVVQLEVRDCPKLRRISNLSKLQNILIYFCPSLAVVEGVPALVSLALEDSDMVTLPEYLRHVNPWYLKLDCSKELQESLVRGNPEFDKIKHITTYTIDIYEPEEGEDEEGEGEDEQFRVADEYDHSNEDNYEGEETDGDEDQDDGEEADGDECEEAEGDEDGDEDQEDQDEGDEADGDEDHDEGEETDGDEDGDEDQDEGDEADGDENQDQCEDKDLDGDGDGDIRIEIVA